MLRAALVVVAAALALGPTASKAADPNQLPTYPQLGRYSNIFGSICGAKKVDTASIEIPKIGCFSVKAGSSLSGNIEGRSVRIDVDIDGNETFSVDANKLHDTHGDATNDILVKRSSTDYAFCRRENANDCPTMINALERVPKQFTVFSVAREFAPNSYVTNEENWDYEQSRGGSHNR